MAVIREGSERAYIEGVRRMSWDTGEMCEFASAVVSAMGALGEDVPYPFVMGVAGTAFRLTLNQEIWNPGSYGVWAVADDPHAPVRRTFAALGREISIREAGSEDADAAAIRESIVRGVPVPAFGVVGPSDFSLVTGYDDGGKTLLGWSTYQDIPNDHGIPPDATGYFRKPEWHGNTRGYVLIGAKSERPARREVYLDALRWAVRLVRQEEVRGMPAGLTAYQVWADAMRRDELFPASDRFGPYLGVLCILMMVDDRAAAPGFLAAAAAEVPEIAPALQAAAECYRETGRVRQGLRELVPEGFSPDAMARLADAGVRRSFAEAILKMRDCDAAAIAHVERGLAERACAS